LLEIHRLCDIACLLLCLFDISVSSCFGLAQRLAVGTIQAWQKL
jgi:hypothetical protein